MFLLSPFDWRGAGNVGVNRGVCRCPQHLVKELACYNGTLCLKKGPNFETA